MNTSDCVGLVLAGRRSSRMGFDKKFVALIAPSKQGISFDFESHKVFVEVDLLPEGKHANR